MTTAAKSFYEVLGVQKTADDRTIKKAYFALVRQFPPETHPEEFKKIREAYEVLSDASSRREYDSIGQYDQHGEGVSEEIRQALDAIEQQRYADARLILSKLLNKSPDLHFARDLLGMAYLHDKKPQQALEIFDDLLRVHADNGAYALHRAYALHQLEKYKDATAAYQHASKLAPDDVRPLVALADCFMDQKLWNDAVKVLDQAINLDGEVNFKDFGLFVRKLQVELERRDTAAVTAVLEQLMKIIPPEEAARKYVANRLGTLAAPLFAQERVDEANLLMREAAKLDPKRGAGVMPANFTVDIELLPDSAKEWLTRMNRENAPTKVKASKYGLAVLFILLSAGAVWYGGSAAFISRQPVEGLGYLMLFGGLAAAGAFFAEGIRRWVVAARSPYGAYSIVHPLYLLQVRVDEVVAWPLANLRDVRVTHHSTNGVYTRSAISLKFAKRTFNVGIYGREASVDWANGILAKRRRVLELMYSGMLEESLEEGPLIPAELVPADDKKPRRGPSRAAAFKKMRPVYAAAVVAAGVLTALAIPLNQRKADDNAWSTARSAYRNKVDAYDQYLAEFPSGRHAAEAKEAKEALYTRALERLKAREGAALVPALTEVVNLLRQKQTSWVNVVYESKTAFDTLDLTKLPEKLRGTVLAPDQAFTATANSGRERQISRALESALDNLLGEGVISVNEYGVKDTPVTFAISYQVGLTGALYESVKDTSRYGAAGAAGQVDKRFLGIGFVWDFGVKLNGEKDARYSFQLQSEPAKNIRWSTYSYGGRAYESPTLPYDKMAESAFEDFKAQLAVRFGDRSARPRDRAAEMREALEGDASEDAEAEEPTPTPTRRRSQRPNVQPAKATLHGQ